MNIENLKMLKILDRCQSISKAAACLYLSQSTLTRQPIMMEKELGFTLFYRLPEGVKPTPGGRYFTISWMPCWTAMTARWLERVSDPLR